MGLISEKVEGVSQMGVVLVGVCSDLSEFYEMALYPGWAK